MRLPTDNCFPLADANDVVLTFPWITDGTDHRGLRIVLPQVLTDGTMQFTAQFTCKGTTSPASWQLTFYHLPILEAQPVHVSDDERLIDTDVSILPTSSYGAIETGTWRFDARQEQ